MMDEFEITIPRVADTLVSQSSLFNCSFKKAWNKHMHPLLTENVNYNDVINYINEQIALGKMNKYLKD